jgi:diazepam-binding inhibitor (GABA receptor modulating acyl-CoA-binding protein)
MSKAEKAEKAEKELEKEFEQSATRVKKLKSRPVDSDLLKLYGLYKQVCEGDCETGQPWAIQMEARAKWDAWNDNKGMEKAKAMKKYIKKVAELVENDK